jgi:predicted RNA binding protein YcfA (HicA-like mRNA interferase family)
VILQKDERVFSVPLHGELKKWTLNGILKQAGLDIRDLEK